MNEAQFYQKYVLWKSCTSLCHHQFLEFWNNKQSSWINGGVWVAFLYAIFKRATWHQLHFRQMAPHKSIVSTAGLVTIHIPWRLNRNAKPIVLEKIHMEGSTSKKWSKQGHFRQYFMVILPPPKSHYVVKQPPNILPFSATSVLLRLNEGLPL